MAQRISRAKRTLQGRRLDRPGDLAVVLRVLYLVYTAGHSGRVDLAAEAIRLARQLTLATEEPEARGLLALMLLSHARLPARFDAAGRVVTLDRQDRGLWDTREIAEGVRVLQSALAVQRIGRYQIEAAISRPARRRGKRRGDRLAADPRLVRRPRRPHRRSGAPGPRRRARGARSRSATSAAPPPGWARPTACATCSATVTAGTPSAATCTSSAATCPPPPRPTPRPPAVRRTSPSATTWSARPLARGPPVSPPRRPSSRSPRASARRRTPARACAASGGRARPSRAGCRRRRGAVELRRDLLLEQPEELVRRGARPGRRGRGRRRRTAPSRWSRRSPRPTSRRARDSCRPPLTTFFMPDVPEASSGGRGRLIQTSQPRTS